MEQGTPQPRPRTLSGIWIWVLLFLFVVYPLSIGPAIKLHQRIPPMRPAIELIYTPLEVAAEYCPPLNRALTWYIRGVWRIRS